VGGGVFFFFVLSVEGVFFCFVFLRERIVLVFLVGLGFCGGFWGLLLFELLASPPCPAKLVNVPARG